MSRIDFKAYRESYSEEGALGSGAFGKIVKVRHRRSGICYALKKILTESPTQRNQAHLQIQILKLCRHPLTVQIFEYYEVRIRNRFSGDGYEVGIVMELGQYSLQQLILSRTNDLSPDTILRFCLQFLRLFAWLQSLNLVHRDVKPANIIVFSEPFHCKLIDFGLCCRADQRPKGVAGSFHYASPKMKKNFQKKKQLIKTNPFKDDVYSFGLTIYELAMNRMTKKEINDAYQDMKMNKQSQILSRLVDQMLTHDEDSRPTFTQLIEDPQIKPLLQSCHLAEVKHQPLCCISFDMEAYPEIEEFKTKKKKEVLKYERFSMKKEGLRCIYSLSSYILCGYQDGNIVALNIEQQSQPLQLRRVHERYVTVMKRDEDGNMWTADGDSKIMIWNTKELQHSIIHNKENVVVEKTNIFQQTPSVEQSQEIRVEGYKALDCPSHKGGISALECISHHRYAVGYYTGHVYIRDDEREMEIKMHSGPVTCLKMVRDRCFSAGMDGVVKSCYLSSMKMTPNINYIGQPICAMELNEENMIELITLEGANQIIDEEAQHVFKKRYPIDHLMAYCIIDAKYVVVNDNGTVLKGSEVICEAEKGGWCTVCVMKENEIAIASHQGEIITISWEEER